MTHFISIYLLFTCFTRESEESMPRILEKRDNYDVCSAYEGFTVVGARFGKEIHFLCLKLQPIGHSSLTSEYASILLEPEVHDENLLIPIRKLPLFNVTMAYGFPVEDPASGSAEGYIGDDQQFYGVLHLGNRTLHADPYGTDDPDKVFGAFESHQHVPRPRREHAQDSQERRQNMEADPRYLPYRVEPRYRLGMARICDLLLLADMEFYRKDANSSLNHVVRRMLHAIAQADIIFRNADFNEDGYPDNIGFSVKYILVLTSEETNSRVFGKLLEQNSVDGREYLMRFARLRRLSEVCLGVAFSGHAFHNRTLGLSFTSLGGGMGGAAGGLCDRRAYGRSFNTLAIAHAIANDKERVPERIAALTLAHEIGHSFGAHHDDNFPNNDCRGHLMGSQSSTVVKGMNFEFSLCSKRLIAATLASMSYCLMDEYRPYCGNGIVEEGEACDCGLPSRCSQKDPCCTPRAGGALVFEDGALHKEGCSVAPSAVCHPSQGLCCMPNCLYADLSKSGIDCTNQAEQCTCTDVELCRCGLGGRCLPDGSCHASECALLGYRECQCYTAPSGTLAAASLCGVCCQLSESDERASCVGAEQAAAAYMQRFKSLPEHWPDIFYTGPNVTISLCHENNCVTSVLRAWAEDEVCVTQGAVGICSQSGVCMRVTHTPRSNIYPQILEVKLKKSGNIAKQMYGSLLITIIVLCHK